MLRLTKRTEYGLIALVYLADQASGTPEGSEAEVVSARAIGDQFPVPRRLLAEALKSLQQGGLLESTRGAQGGYRLARGASEISLGEIVAALEGAPTLTSCAGLGAAGSDGACEVEPVCPIRSPLARLRSGIWALFEGVSLQQLADRSVDPVELFSSAST
jgi:Rrf2 family protein